VGPDCSTTAKVCHFPDPDPLNNKIEKLRWGTKRDNWFDKIAHGTDQRGSRDGNAKLTEEGVLAIRAAREAGETKASIAARYGITPSAVYMIEHRKRWAHI
jgi:hypothetical protein